MKTLNKALKSVLTGILFLAIGHFSMGQSNVVTIGTGTSTSSFYPVYGFYDYSWSATLYTAAEINKAGNIESLAWYVGNTPANYTFTSQSIYLSHTSLSNFPDGSQPSTATSTLVYSGDLTFNGSGWATVVLTTPFAYNGVDNLLIYWANNDGVYASGQPSFRYTSTSPDYRCIYKYADGSFPNVSGSRTTSRPNIQIGFPLLPYDANLLSIDAPVTPGTVGSSPVEISLQNDGSQTLTSIVVNWEVNGTAKPAFNWTGSLATGASAANVNIGNANLVAGFNVINVWLGNINGQADQNAINNTATKEVIACAGPMTGSYTIGSGGDFPSFSAAVATLETCGVGGPVNFYAFNGTYNEQVRIPEITGASATNTITFQSLSGNAAAVVLNYAPAGSSDNYTLELDGADYITFQNMTLQTDPGNSAAYGRVIEFASSATYNMISNCIIKGREISTTSNNYSAIYASSSLIQNNVLTGNQIQYGTYAIYWNGSSSSSLGMNNIISNNTVTDFSYYGLRIYYQDACIVDGNTFKSAATYATV